MVAYAAQPLAQAAGDEGEEGVVPQQLIPAGGHGEAEAVALPHGLHSDGGAPGLHQLHLAEHVEGGGELHHGDLSVIKCAEDLDLSPDEQIELPERLALEVDEVAAAEAVEPQLPKHGGGEEVLHIPGLDVVFEEFGVVEKHEDHLCIFYHKTPALTRGKAPKTSRPLSAIYHIDFRSLMM